MNSQRENDRYARSSPNFKPLLNEFQRIASKCNRISYSTQYFDFLLVTAILVFFFGGIFMIMWSDFFLTESEIEKEKRKKKEVVEKLEVETVVE